MFIEIPTAEGSYEFVNTDNITKVFTHRDITRVNLVDGSYTVSSASKEEIMELIYHV